MDSHGYSDLVSAIADMPVPKLEEFAIEADMETAPPNEEGCDLTSKNLEDTKRMFHRTPLKYLKFFINSDKDIATASIPQSVQSNLDLLGELHYLEHLDLSLNYNKSEIVVSHGMRIIPIPEKLKQRLKILTLRHLVAGKDDLVGLLASMPNLQNVTLRHLHCRFGYSCWKPVLSRIRDHYRTKDCPTKPNFTIIQPSYWDPTSLHLVNEEVNDYLFGNGDDPIWEIRNMPYADLDETSGWRISKLDETVCERMADFCERLTPEDFGRYYDT